MSFQGEKSHMNQMGQPDKKSTNFIPNTFLV